MRALPKFLEKYFWDVDFPKLNKNLHSRFIIERILEEGDEEAVNWMEKNFQKREIKNVILNSKNLSPKSANFWSLLFNISKDKVLCLKKSFREKQKKFWKR